MLDAATPAIRAESRVSFSSRSVFFAPHREASCKSRESNSRAKHVWQLALILLLTLSVSSIDSSVARADIFVLETGGQVVGNLINVKRRVDDDYQVALEGGGEATFAANQIREVIRRRPVEIEYEQLAPTFADTAEGQWSAAEWCRVKSLTAYRQHHLRRVVELNPGHAKAWAALGYTQINGRWQRAKDLREHDGYELHEGKWRLSQDIELIEERQEKEAAITEWTKKVVKWHELTRTGERASAEAFQQLADIRDPLAVPGLLLCMSRERRPNFRIFFVDLLDKISSPMAIDAVGRASLYEANPEVFHAAADRMMRHKSPQLVEAYCAALEDADNTAVNRAAYMLGRLEDRSATLPLIRKLTSNHIVATYPQVLAMAPMRSPSTGRSSIKAVARESTVPVFVPMQFTNSEVLTALTKLTGQDFGYDTEAWLRWHANHVQENFVKVKPRDE